MDTESMPGGVEQPEISVAVICNQWPLPGWQAHLLAGVLAVAGTRLTDVRRCPATRPGIAHRLRQLLAETLWGGSCRARPGGLPPESMPPRDCPGIAGTDNHSGADIYLDFGGCPDCVARLSAGSTGVVWQWDLDGPLPGLDALVGRRSVIQATLYRVKGDGHSRQPLRTAGLRLLDYSLGKSVDGLFQFISRWPRELLGNREGEPGRASAGAVTPVPENDRWPPLSALLRGAMCLAYNKARHLLHVLFRDEIWHVGVMDYPIQELVRTGRPPPVRWLPQPERGRMYADPFGVVSDGVAHVLFEDLVFSQGKAWISCAPVEVPDPIPKPCIRSANHLSYPFCFEYQDHGWCVPESARDNEVCLYRAGQQADSWERAGTLLEGFPGVDTTLVHYRERWWMFCGKDDDYPNVNLYVFFAHDPRGPWVAHGDNPVKSDIRNSRSGGTPFIEDGVLYRPAQDSRHTYGGRVVINRVTVLTPTEFAEEEVAWVEPDPAGCFPDGLHTLSALGQRTLVDGKRFFYTWRKLPGILRKVAGK